MILNDVINTFKSFFSRAFWFGNFLPVAVFAALHGVIAWWVVPGVNLETLFSNTASKAIFFPAGFATLVVLAYAATPLIPVMRGLLDGSLLPEVLHNALRREHLVLARSTRRKVNAAFELFTTVADLNFTKSREIWKARKDGIAAGTIIDRQAIEFAITMVDTLESRYDRGRPPAVKELRDAVEAMIAALRVNNIDLPEASGLGSAQERLMQILNDAEADAQLRWQTLQARYRHISFDRPQTTRMADTRYRVESYCANAYGVDFNYIWPRLQMVLPQQGAQGDVGSFNDHLAAARAQIDFAILSLTLSLTVPLFWLPYLASTAQDPALFAFVGAITPLLVGFFYYIALESQVAFGDVMKGAIDTYRFSLLGNNLRQHLPQTLSEERQLWARLQDIDVVATREIYFRPPKPTE